MQHDTLMSSEEVADYLGVTKWTVNRWRCGESVNLPFVRIGRVVRYKLSDVKSFLKKYYTKPIKVKGDVSIADVY